MTEADRDFIHAVLTDPVNSRPFIWHGSTPGTTVLLEEMEATTLMMHVVRARSSGERIGVVLLTNPNLRDGHGFITVAAAPSATGKGLVLEGLIGLIHLAFSAWPFHKLYADVDDIALQNFRTAVGRYLVPEGRFIDHHRREGRRVDVHRLALYRTTWERSLPRIRRTMRIELAALDSPACGTLRERLGPP